MKLDKEATVAQNLFLVEVKILYIENYIHGTIDILVVDLERDSSE